MSLVVNFGVKMCAFLPIFTTIILKVQDHGQCVGVSNEGR